MTLYKKTEENSMLSAGRHARKRKRQMTLHIYKHTHTHTHTTHLSTCAINDGENHVPGTQSNMAPTWHMLWMEYGMFGDGVSSNLFFENIIHFVSKRYEIFHFFFWFRYWWKKNLLKIKKSFVFSSKQHRWFECAVCSVISTHQPMICCSRWARCCAAALDTALASPLPLPLTRQSRPNKCLENACQISSPHSIHIKTRHLFFTKQHTHLCQNHLTSSMYTPPTHITLQRRWSYWREISSIYQ